MDFQDFFTHKQIHQYTHSPVQLYRTKFSTFVWNLSADKAVNDSLNKNHHGKRATKTQKNEASPAGGSKIVASNRKAYHEYFVEQKFTAGIILSGTEVKSVKKRKGEHGRFLLPLQGR